MPVRRNWKALAEKRQKRVAELTKQRCGLFEELVEMNANLKKARAAAETSRNDAHRLRCERDDLQKALAGWWHRFQKTKLGKLVGQTRKLSREPQNITMSFVGKLEGDAFDMFKANTGDEQEVEMKATWEKRR